MNAAQTSTFFLVTVQNKDVKRASNSLNKWLRKHVLSGCVLHSFRHSIRDRLRAVECPAEIIDQLGGWTTAGVGRQYGLGYGLVAVQRWISSVSFET